jgi:hypothetical protein
MRLETKPGNLDGRNPAWTPPFHRSSPAATAGPNCLVGDVRRLAYDHSLAPDDAMRRIRDAFGVNDGIIIEDDAGSMSWELARL